MSEKHIGNPLAKKSIRDKFLGFAVGLLTCALMNYSYEHRLINEYNKLKKEFDKAQSMKTRSQGDIQDTTYNYSQDRNRKVDFTQ